MVGSIDNIVVVGYMEDVYCLTVHGIPLGYDNYPVVVQVAFVEEASLLIPNEDLGAILVGYIVGPFIAWPKFLIIFDDMMVNKLSFRLFCLIKNNLLTHWFYYWWTRIRDDKKGKRDQLNHKFPPDKKEDLLLLLKYSPSHKVKRNR